MLLIQLLASRPVEKRTYIERFLHQTLNTGHQTLPDIADFPFILNAAYERGVKQLCGFCVIWLLCLCVGKFSHRYQQSVDVALGTIRRQTDADQAALIFQPQR